MNPTEEQLLSKIDRVTEITDDPDDFGLANKLIEIEDKIEYKDSCLPDIDSKVGHILDSINKESHDVVVKNSIEVKNFPQELSLKEPKWFSWEGIKEHLSDLVSILTANLYEVEVKNPQKEVTLVDKDGKPIDLENIGSKKPITVYGGGRSIKSEESLDKLVGEYALVLDDVTTTSMTYVGKAAMGSATSAASWQIKRIDESGTPNTLVIKWADGDASFNNVWDNRASLTYS